MRALKSFFLGGVFLAQSLPLFSQDRHTLTFEAKKGPVSFHVELALTPEQQKQGLAGRADLGEREGMLFYFQTPRVPVFWMKETSLPLDLLFLDEKGCIQGIARGIPLSEKRLKGSSPAKAVLEIKGGHSQKYGLAAGICARTEGVLF